MTNSRPSAWLVAAVVVVCCVVVASAADRVRAGQWETTMTISGQVLKSSACMSESDAAAMNGDASSIRAFVEKSSAKAGCRVLDVTLKGNQVSVTTVCRRAENVGTTTYTGDTSETVNTNGAKVQARRLGPCT